MLCPLSVSIHESDLPISMNMLQPLSSYIHGCRLPICARLVHLLCPSLIDSDERYNYTFILIVFLIVDITHVVGERVRSYYIATRNKASVLPGVR